jgi:hypothetical protein
MSLSATLRRLLSAPDLPDREEPAHRSASWSTGGVILPKPYRAEDLWVSLERAVAG